jgi:hypothetical protein
VLDVKCYENVSYYRTNEPICLKDFPVLYCCLVLGAAGMSDCLTVLQYSDCRTSRLTQQQVSRHTQPASARLTSCGVSSSVSMFLCFNGFQADTTRRQRQQQQHHQQQQQLQHGEIRWYKGGIPTATIARPTANVDRASVSRTVAKVCSSPSPRALH